MEVETAANIAKDVSMKDAHKQGGKKGSGGGGSCSSPAGFPPYASLIFGCVRMDDEHVTVWEPSTGKTVAGNAAPYRRNLSTWLKAHPGWQEKADELKSSKRRSAARRAKAAAASFAQLCAHTNIAKVLLSDLSDSAGIGDSEKPNGDFSAEEFVKLEESLVRMGEQLLSADGRIDRLPHDRWLEIAANVNASRSSTDVLQTAKYILDRGISSHQEIHSNTAEESKSRSSDHDNLSKLGSSLTASEKGIRTQKEPRVTVWEPMTGRTVSGNAAPCKRNVAAWIAAHPGWEVKRDDQLSASRRAKKMMAYESDEEGSKENTDKGLTVECGSPTLSSSVLSDALEGLLNLRGNISADESDFQRVHSSSSSISDDENELGLKRGAPAVSDDMEISASESRVKRSLREKKDKPIIL